MRPDKLIRIALRSIARTKMRSTLTALGIIIGVGAVIVMVAIGHGAKSRIEQSIRNLGTNMVVITPGTSSSGGVSRGAGSFNRLTVEDADKLKRESLLLSEVTPVVMTFSRIRGGGNNWRAPIYGVDTSYQQIRDWNVSAGPVLRPEGRARPPQGVPAGRRPWPTTCSPGRTRWGRRSSCAACPSR